MNCELGVYPYPRVALTHFYQGTPIFISRAVERGQPVPLESPFYLSSPKVPKVPEHYAKAHAHTKRIDDSPEDIEDLVVDPCKLVKQSQDYKWRHELDHDVESVFWLFLYWAMVTQPKGRPAEYIHPGSWTNLLGNSEDQDGLVMVLSSGNAPEGLTHSFYEPLWPLIRSFAAILVVDKHWLPQSDARKCPDYICEAFQRLIIQFILSNCDKDSMAHHVDKSLHETRPVPLSQALTITPIQLRDGLERETEAKQRRLNSAEVGRVCAIFEFLSFLLLCSQDEDEDEDELMQMIE